MEYSKEDLMEAKKQIWGVGENMGTEESKKIWEENAQFWDNAIQYTFNAFCKVVIRHAAIDKILKLRRRWEREVSLDYLMSEKFVQLAEPE